MAFETMAEYKDRIDQERPANPGGHVVCDRDGYRTVTRGDMVAVKVEVNGEVRGSMMLCSLLDDDVLARNLSWQTKLDLGYGVIFDVTAASSVLVSLADGVVRIIM